MKALVGDCHHQNEMLQAGKRKDKKRDRGRLGKSGFSVIQARNNGGPGSASKGDTVARLMEEICIHLISIHEILGIFYRLF